MPPLLPARTWPSRLVGGHYIASIRGFEGGRTLVTAQRGRMPMRKPPAACQRLSWRVGGLSPPPPAGLYGFLCRLSALNRCPCGVGHLELVQQLLELALLFLVHGSRSFIFLTSLILLVAHPQLLDRGSCFVQGSPCRQVATC